MIDLKPCPFCGGKAVIKPDNRYYLDDYKIIECTECGATLMSMLESAEELSETWNRRTENGNTEK